MVKSLSKRRLDKNGPEECYSTRGTSAILCRRKGMRFREQKKAGGGGE
jgi:hypothetical protein